MNGGDMHGLNNINYNAQIIRYNKIKNNIVEYALYILPDSGVGTNHQRKMRHA